MKSNIAYLALFLGLFLAGCKDNNGPQGPAGKTGKDGSQQSPTPTNYNDTLGTYEGAGSSGGGKGVVCRDAKGNITKPVELLDLWEAKNIYKKTIVESNEDIKVQVDKALDKISKFIVQSPYSEITYGDGSSPADHNLALDAFAGEQERWFQESEFAVVEMRGVNLALTQDSHELATPGGNCRIEQIVNYQDASGKNIFVNQDLRDKMSKTQQAALIAHEIFYKYLRENSRETNSVRVRRTVGLTFSDETFTPISIPKGHRHCYGYPTGEARIEELGKYTTEFILIPSDEIDEEYREPGMGYYKILPLRVAGIIVLGVTHLERSIDLVEDASLVPEELMTASSSMSSSFIVSEIDRQMNVSLDTYDTDGIQYLRAKLLGADGTTELGEAIEMECAQVNDVLQEK